jgi:peptidoglycan/LPS O-acetylase OafA/YrhL
MITSNTRYTKLDGLRGLLSLVVALNHSFLILLIPAFANVWGQNIFAFTDLQSKIQQIFMLLGNGGVAVTMFFVLSGLVMGQSLKKIEQSLSGVLGFYVKRMTRLYPAYFFLIVFSALYMRLGFVYRTYPVASTWFHWWMNFEMTLSEFFRNAYFASISLGGVTWTLRVIVIASFIFPFFYFITKNTSKYLDLILSVVLVYASFTVLNIAGFRDFRYLYMFFAGLILPKFRSTFENFPKWLFFVTLPFCLYILLDLRYMTNEYVGGLGEAVVAWFYLGLMSYNHKETIFNFLDSKFLQFFGKISYSLYLIHFSVLYIFAKLVLDYLPNLPYTQNYVAIHLMFFIISTILATYLSIFMNKFVEEPSVKLASYISEKFKK